MGAIRWPAHAGSKPGRAAVRAGLACLAAAAVCLGFAAPASAGVGYSVVPSPDKYTGYNVLYGVSASSGSDAWAVGSLCCKPGYFGDGTLTEHWNGSTWSIVPSPDFFRIDDVLTGVADLSAGNVWAVGYIRPFASQTTSPLIIHSNGSSWGITAASTSVPGTLRAISADSATDIWAVGDDAHGHAVAMRYNGTAWSQVALPAGGASGTLAGVKAFGPADVWAVGSSAAGKTLVLHWTGSAWSVVPSPNPDPGSDSLLAVGGLASNDLWAVGQQGADKTLTEHWDGTSWTVAASPNTGGQDRLTAVAATGTAAVAAVGSYHTGSGTALTGRTLALQWNGTSWATQPTPNVGTADNMLLGAAAIPGSGTVWAVGLRVFVTLSGFRVDQTLILKGVSS
jgi:hypothetical protein